MTAAAFKPQHVLLQLSLSHYKGQCPRGKASCYSRSTGFSSRPQKRFQNDILSKNHAIANADIALTLERVEEVMEHWREVMPGKVLRIPYERLVQDPEAVVKGILEHCNMPWEPAVLDFHSNPRLVSTASLAQVQSQLVPKLILQKPTLLTQ